jgi:hypothetical protein
MKAGFILGYRFVKGHATSMLICFALTFLSAGCKAPENDEIFAYIIEIVDDGAGQCTYYLNDSPETKTRKYIIVSECARWNVGDRIYIPKLDRAVV